MMPLPYLLENAYDQYREYASLGLALECWDYHGPIDIRLVPSRLVNRFLDYANTNAALVLLENLEIVDELAIDGPTTFAANQEAIAALIEPLMKAPAHAICSIGVARGAREYNLYQLQRDTDEPVYAASVDAPSREHRLLAPSIDEFFSEVVVSLRTGRGMIFWDDVPFDQRVSAARKRAPT